MGVAAGLPGWMTVVQLTKERAIAITRANIIFFIAFLLVKVHRRDAKSAENRII
jgi:hypothetical protein